jgi:hypothetical protein
LGAEQLAGNKKLRRERLSDAKFEEEYEAKMRELDARQRDLEIRKAAMEARHR